jgi:hypothetical protein
MAYFTVYVDSNNRNQALWPNSNSYVLHLTNPIMNITKAELVSAMLPSVTTSQFICLDIEELKTPQHQIADALTVGTANVVTTTSNAFNSSFAIVPIKASGTFEFYNQNYRIKTDYPSRIDKLDRLTIRWRQPNKGTLYFDGSDLGRNMFLLRFETENVPIEPARLESLPDPVPWGQALVDQRRMVVVAIFGILGLLAIMSIRRTRRIQAIQNQLKI